IKIKVRHAEAWRRVGLGERKGWAWDLGCDLAQQGSDERAGKRGFASSYLTAQGDDVATAQLERQQLGQLDDAGLIKLARPLRHPASGASEAGPGWAPPFGKAHGDTGALAGFRFERHGSTVQLHEALDDGKPQPGAPVLGALAAALEPLKH